MCKSCVYMCMGTYVCRCLWVVYIYVCIYSLCVSIYIYSVILALPDICLIITLELCFFLWDLPSSARNLIFKWGWY